MILMSPLAPTRTPTRSLACNASSAKWWIVLPTTLTSCDARIWIATTDVPAGLWPAAICSS